MKGMLSLVEDETFYFDEEAAARPVRFIEKYCRHYQGKHADKPFILEPIQRQIVRDLFGWKWRATGLRRFTDCYFEAAVGAGKSPLLAAIGLYGLMGDREPAAQVYSLASSYNQARIVFDTAKKFAGANIELAKRLKMVDREIRYPPNFSTWQIVSGDGPGAGRQPSLILGDEIHQWKGAGGYYDLRERMTKRAQPLLIAATNAGETRASFCWQLREKAVAALKGQGEVTLYPIIWAADEHAPTDDANAWREANPLIGVTMDERQVRQQALAAMKTPEEEANFRRCYMGIWPKGGAGRWLDLALWDSCESAEAPPEDAPLYVGVDLSQGDDLCAAVYIRVTPERFYLSAEFWLPKATAKRYEEAHGIPYTAWANAGHIHLLDEATISSAARQQIAKRIINKGKATPIKAVCYDRYKVDEVIATLEAAEITCVPIPQGYTISPGCNELERRLKESAIVIAANPVLRWNAENTEVKSDDRGNFWPVKPNAKGRYAGTRGIKIDGITATVTALTEARKYVFPIAQEYYRGIICSSS